jgi:antitoxin (DNA-binding transcriptional repressor) of toxin-antitoxin stability system
MSSDISITEFHRDCSKLIRHVCKTGQSLRIIRNGKPVVEVRPLAPCAAAHKRKFLGEMIGTAEILGDIVSPMIDTE